MKRSIDLNADLGEGFGAYDMGDDAAMLEIITSANVACGFHAGDPQIMDRTVRMALDNGVAIGAHPGFNDLWGFGRRPIHGDSAEEISNMLIYQMGALQGFVQARGARLSHVKVHGALANMASVDRALADAYCQAVKRFNGELNVTAIVATELEHAAVAAGLRPLREIYADRAYNDDATLRSRKLPGAVIHDAGEACERVLQMLEEGAVISTNGIRIPVEIDTICVHGDNAESVATAGRLRDALERQGYTLNPPN